MDIGARLVEQVSTEYAITLGLSGGLAVRIETSFVLSEPGHAPLTIDPQNLDTDRELQRALLGRTVNQAIAEVDAGSLEITFDGGISVLVPSDADFEAWAVTWPDGYTVVSLPGGGLSQWGAQQ